MSDLYSLTDKAIIRMLGGHLKRLRLDANMTQKQLAADAGVALSCVASLETGRGSTLSTLVAVLRVLGALEMIESLTEQDEVSPIEYARFLQGRRKRQRASGTKRQKEEDAPW